MSRSDQPPLLNAELYARDADHSEYGEVANDVVMERYGAVPSLARDISLNHLRDVAAQTGMARQLARWQRDIEEAFQVAFLVAKAEDWSDLDRETFEKLMEASYAQTNSMREAVGSDRVDRSDFSAWVSILLLSFVHEAEEWQPLTDYIESRGAFARVNSLQETYSMIGHHLAGLKDRDSKAWLTLDHFARRDGILLAVLEEAGILATPEAAAQPLHADDRPLTSELEETDPQAYLAGAVELIQLTSHRVPDVAKELYWHIASLLLDGKTGERYPKHLQDTFEGGFVIAQSETWRELDRDKTLALIDSGIRTVIAELDTRDPDVLIRDPEYRIRNTALGIVLDSRFPDLLEYLAEQPSYQRTMGVGDLVVGNVLTTLKRRQRKELETHLALAWHFGVVVGLLDLVGEVPTAMPQRL